MRIFSHVIVTIIAIIFLSTVFTATTPAATTSSQLVFSGYSWDIVKLATPTGIGNTRFYYNSSSDYVDGNGYLHMNLLNVGGVIYASEINLTKALGYGTYTIDIQGPISNLDKCAVFGIFTWDNGAETSGNLYNREIDFLEASKWCSAGVSKSGSSVVQPADDGQLTSQYTTFNLSTSGDDILMTATWLANYVNIKLVDADTNRILSSWTYTGSGVPTPGNADVHINLWQFNGGQIATNQQVVVKSFSFSPTTGQPTTTIPTSCWEPRH